MSNSMRAVVAPRDRTNGSSQLTAAPETTPTLKATGVLGAGGAGAGALETGAVVPVEPDPVAGGAAG
jgi:hypothetical protein